MTILGTSDSGKTSIVNRLLKRTQNVSATIQVGQFNLKFLSKQQKRFFNVDLTIIDTAGTEKFNAITSSAIRNADICLLVFDLANPHSFREVTKWKQLQFTNSEKCQFVLVGNKCDLQREVDYQMIQGLVTEQEIERYVECSAKSGQSIEKLLVHSWPEKADDQK